MIHWIGNKKGPWHEQLLPTRNWGKKGSLCQRNMGKGDNEIWPGTRAVKKGGGGGSVVSFGVGAGGGGGWEVGMGGERIWWGDPGGGGGGNGRAGVVRLCTVVREKLLGLGSKGVGGDIF